MQFDCGKSTAIEIMDEVTTALICLLSSIICFPLTINDVQEHIDAFEEITNFPQVVGLIDGTHISIIEVSK